MKKFFVRLLILAVVFFSLYACRHFFIGTALEFALKRSTGNTAVYNNRYWEDGRLFYEGFSLGEQLYAEEAAFDVDFHLFPFSIDAAVHLNTPTVQLGEGQTNLAFLLPAKYWTLKLDIEKGSLLSEEKKLCLFEFASGLEKEEIGKLSVFQEDGAPLFSCGFNYSAESLAIDFQMDEAPLEKTLPLACLFYPLPTWKVLEGSASADLKGNLDMEQLSFLQGKFSLQDVRLESEDLIFAADQAASMVDYQGKIDTLALDTDFKGVDLFWKELEVLRGEGSVVYKPQTTPTFEVHAAVHVADLEGRADLIGKGEIRDNYEWLEGKGEILHRSLWLEGTLDYVTANNPLRVEFTLTDDVLQAEIHNLGKEILGLLNPKIKQGSLDGKATAHLEQGIFHRLQLDDIVVHELVYDHFSIPETQLQGSVNLISGEIEQLNLQAHDAAGDVQGWKIASTELAIAIEDNQFKPSSAFGKFEGVPFALELQGPLSSFHAHAKLIAGASEWMKLPKNLEEPPVILDLTFDRKAEELQIVGTLACLEDTVQLSAQANLSTPVLKGVFQTPRVQSSFYKPVLKIFAPALAMQGEVSLRGQFSEKTIDILAQGEDLIVKSPDFQLSVLGQSREILYHYDFVAKQGSGKGKLSPILFTTPQFSQGVSITGGELSFDETSLSCQALTGQISGIDVEGDLTANWKEKLTASFSSQKIQGLLENLIPSYDLRGCFTLEKVHVHYADGKVNYRFNSLLEEVEGALTPQLQIQKTSCSLQYDSLENQLIVQKLKGTLFEDVTFSAQEILYQNGQWNFEGAFNQNTQTLLSLQGKALATALGYQVTLQEAQASKSYLKSPLTFHWTPQRIDQVRGEVFIDTANLFEQLHLLDRLGLPLSSDIKETLQQLQGTLTLKLIIDADRSEYEVQGSQIRYASTLFGAVSAHLVQQGSQWSLKQCSFDDIKIKGEAAFQNAKWIVSSCTIDWKDLKLYTSGIYEKKRFDFKAEGQLNRFSLTGNGTFFSESPQFQNLSLNVLDQSEQLATLSCDKIVYKNGKWESPALDLTLFSPELAVPLRTKLHLSLSPQSTTFQGTASQGEINIGKAALKITQIYGLYEASYLNLKCLATLGEEPLHFLAKFNEQFAGGVNIQNGKDVLKLALSDLKTCQKAEGELFGINVNLQREGQGFKGTVILKDPAKLAELMGTENLKDYFGLQLTGLFTKETFKGELEGRDARIKDYLVEEIHATVDYAPTRFKLKNLTLQDPAGSFTVKECNGFRSSALDPWNVTIPLLKGQEIKPSAIRKLGASQKEIKPLQIRYFVMTDILGQLGDLSSFRGQGKFNFTQRVKKEPSLFDIPLALLKDFGLDLDLFSPVMGEVQLQLKEGKLFFTNLQNAFSEGKRSEFYLAEQPSYIDLSGGLFLNLRMQQNVVLKLVEPFMIAVRGTWEKPKYSLQ